MPDPTVFTYDIFISYSHADSKWVTQTLLPRLEAARLKVCVDARDFRPGAPSVKEMARAVQNSRKTVLVLTPAYLASAWAEFEHLMLQTLDPANRQLRLIPLLKDKCDLPLEIGYLTYVNFADPDDLAWPWTQLLTALGAPPIQEAPPAPERPGWFLPHPYGAQPNFTGRAAERRMLSGWLAEGLARPEPAEGLTRPELVEGPPQPLLVLRALGGFGKRALAWHWLHHDVDAARWPRAVWWSFYEGDSQFDSFLRKTLAYLLGPKGAGRFQSERQTDEYLGGQGPRQQADVFLDFLRQPGTLLILDGFERALRAFSSMMAAYQGDEAQETGDRGQELDGFRPSSSVFRHSDRDCVSPIAEYFLRSLATLPGLRGKVLMTTRLRPRIVEGHGEELLLGCCEQELTQMEPADAVAFFRGQGIRGARAEIEAACAPYGYHPLSLRLLAGLIANDLRQPGDIAAARRLDVASDLIQRQHHVLEQAYESLTADRRRLLSRIACFRGPVAYDALAALADDGRGEARPRPKRRRKDEGDREGRVYDLDADLHDLLARGLLHRDHKTNRFDLHPIVRRYAYDRLAGADRTAAHRRLRDYFAAVPSPEQVRTLDDLAPVIELYYHTVRAGQYDEACILFRDRISEITYYQFGAYQLRIQLLTGLFPDGDPLTSSGQTTLPRLKDESAQAWTLSGLANSYGLNGQPARAAPLVEAQITIREKQGDKDNLVTGLENLAGMAQICIGALQAAEDNLRRAITLSHQMESDFAEAVEHQELGRLLAYRGAWAESETELLTAQKVFDEMGPRETNYGSANWAFRALAALLMERDQFAVVSPQSAIAAARRALELSDEFSRQRFALERDYVQAHWLLGAALRAAGPSTSSGQGLGRGGLNEAGRHLTEALARCRAINMVEKEADILLDLARVRWDERSFAVAQDDKEKLREEAERLAEEALTITERSGYVLQGADVHLFLAKIEIERGDREKALAHAREARRLATCDGPPDHTYKVAYDEAGALLEKLGEGWREI